MTDQPAQPVELDRVDRQILAMLQVNGRIHYGDLARQVELSPSPCHRRVRLLEEAGVIERYAALLDAEKVGAGLTVFACVWLKDQRNETIERVASAIHELPEVTECHLMAGDADLLLRIAVADIAGYRRFQMDRLARIQDIKRIKAEMPLQEIKQTSELPL